MIKENKGFTMVELIVSVALLAIILIPVSKFFTDSFRVQSKTQMRSSATRVGQEVVEKLKNKQISDLGFVNLNKTKVKVKYDNGKPINEFTSETIDGYMTHETTIERGNIRYQVELQIDDRPILNDTVDVEIPEYFDYEVEINDLGQVTGYYPVLSGYELDLKNVGTSFSNKGKTYTASIETFILNNGNVDKGYAHTLLIKNECENKVKIGIVKNFKNPLKIYIKGSKNIYFEDGALGDGRSYEEARFETVYLGDVDFDGSQNEGELLLGATLIVTDSRDTTVRDVFEVTFPIDYDYSENI